MKRNKKLLTSLSIALLSTSALGGIVGASISNNANNNNSVIANENVINSRMMDQKAAPAITALETLSDSIVVGKKPSEIAYKINELAPNGVVRDQSTTIEYLKKFFNWGESGVDGNTLTIKNLRTTADSINGKLTINFQVVSGDIIQYIVQGSFDEGKGLTKGLTAINKFVHNDTTNNYAAIKTKLGNNTDGLEYLKTSQILNNLSDLSGYVAPSAPAQKANATNTVIDFNDTLKIITIKSIKITKAIGVTTLQDTVLEGNIAIYPTDASKNAPTSWDKKTDYLNDPLFKTAINADKFVELINSGSNKTDEGFIGKILNVVNKPEGATIAIKSAIKSGLNASVTFTISKYYDQNGQLVDSEKEFTLTYDTFPVNNNTTYVNYENELNVGSKEFAYQYDNEAIRGIINADITGSVHNIVKNPVAGSTATVTITETNNRSGMITATITLSKAINEDGSEQVNKDFVGVKFKVAKTINKPTTLIRNNEDVTETIRQIEEKSPEEKKIWAEKYIDTDGKVASPATSINVIEVVRVAPPATAYATSEDEKAALYKVTAKLTNYIKNDELYSLNTSESTEIFTVYINAKMTLATRLIDTVATTGINADGTIENLTPTQLINPTTTHHETLKQWIISKQTEIFENAPSLITIKAEGFNVAAVESSPNSVEVTLTLTNAYLFNGLSGEATFKFKINNLGVNIWTSEKTQVTIDAQSLGKNTVFASAYAKDPATKFEDVITKEIKDNNVNKNYFENLPDLVETDKIIKEGEPIVDDVNGEILITYKLPKFYVKGAIETPTSPENNPNAIIYQAKIFNFKKVNNAPFKDMPKEININYAQLNTSVNNGSPVSAYDYVGGIKTHITTWLDDNGTNIFPADQLTTVKEKVTALSQADFQLIISTAQSKAVNNISAKVVVKNAELATASGDENWNSGYVFTLNNAKYANTDFTGDKAQDLSLTMDEFNAKNTDKKAQIDILGRTINYAPTDVYGGTDYTKPNGLNIVAEGDNLSGKAVIKITFPKFYINNQEISNHIITFNFTFKAGAATTTNNYLKDTAIAPNTLDNTLAGTNILDDLVKLNEGTINFSSKNDILLNDGIAAQYPDLSLNVPANSATISPDGTHILVNVEITVNGKKVVEQIKVGPYSTFTMLQTNPVASSSLPEGVTFDTIEQKIADESALTKDQYINWTEGKIPTTNEAIKLTKAVMDSRQEINTTTIQKVAFVDFWFNGVYLKANDIKSFVSNYVVKLKIDFSADGQAIQEMRIVWSGSQDEYISATIANPKNNNWIIYTIISALIISLIAIYAAKTIYDKKNKEKKIINE